MPNSKIAKFTGWGIVVAALLIGSVGLYAYFNYLTFRTRVAAIKSSGDPVSLADIKLVEPDEGEDALKVLLPFKEKLMELAATVPSPNIQTAENEMTTAEAIESFEEVYNTNPELFTAIAQAADCTGMSYPDLYSTPEFTVMDWQKVLRLMDWKAQVQLAQNNPDETARTCLEMIQIAKIVEKPTLLQFLLSQAFQISAYSTLTELVQTKEIAPQILDELRSVLESASPAQAYQNAVRSEQAFAIESLTNPELIADPNTLPVVYKIKGLGASLIGLSMLDEYEIIISRADQSFSTQFPLLENQGSSSWNPYDSQSNMFERFRNKAGENLALARVLRILIELHNSGAEFGERNPTRMELIEIGIPKHCLTDPFTEKQLIVEKTKERWHVYSLGKNKKDDEDPTENIGTKKTGLGLANIQR